MTLRTIFKNPVSGAFRYGGPHLLNLLALTGVLLFSTAGLSGVEEQRNVTEPQESRRPVTVQGVRPVRPVKPITGIQESLTIQKPPAKGRVEFRISERAGKRLNEIADKDMERFLNELQKKQEREFEQIQAEFSKELKAMQRLFESDRRYQLVKEDYDKLIHQLKSATDEDSRREILKDLDRFMNANRQLLKEAVREVGLTSGSVIKRAGRIIKNGTIRFIDLGGFVVDAIRDSIVPNPGYAPDAGTCESPPFKLASKKKTDRAGSSAFSGFTNRVSESSGRIRQSSSSFGAGFSLISGYHRIPVTVPPGYTRMKVTATFDHEYSFISMAFLGVAVSGGDVFLRIYGWDEGERISGTSFSLDDYYSLIAWMGSNDVEEERSIVHEIPISNNGGEFIIRTGVTTETMATGGASSSAYYEGTTGRVCVELLP